MDSILQSIEDWFRELLVSGIMNNLTNTFDSVNNQVGQIATEVGRTPANFSPAVYNMIRTLSENVIMPIAGLILTFIACYELIQLVISHNNLANFETWIFWKWIFKTFVAVTLITNTMNITMAVFDVAQHVVSQAGGIIGSSTAIDASTLATMQSTLEAMDIGPLLSIFLQSFTADGWKNATARVSASDVKPGDLIFFQGTYDTSGASHVGIVVDPVNKIMIHCGNPIQYEADLLALMDEDAVNDYIAQKEAKETEPTVTEEPTQTEETEPADEPVEPEKKKNSGVLVIVLILALGGAGGYVYFTKVKNKKPMVDNAPDPDADYDDDEDDYLDGLADEVDEILSFDDEDESRVLKVEQSNSDEYESKEDE